MSISSISNFDCLRGNTSIQQTLVSEMADFDTIANKDIASFTAFKNSLFYVSMLLLTLNSLIRFDKEFKIKSIINIFIVLAAVIHTLVSHNYITYLVLINIYLLYDFATYNTKKDILCAITSALSAILCCVCIIMLYKHFCLLTLFEFPDMIQPTVQSSKHILTTFKLWAILYGVIGIKTLCLTFKTSR